MHIKKLKGKKAESSCFLKFTLTNKQYCFAYQKTCITRIIIKKGDFKRRKIFRWCLTNIYIYIVISLASVYNIL